MMVVNTDDNLQMSNLDSALHDFYEDDEPHKNAERYLNLEPIDNLNKHLCAIAYNEESRLMLGRSSLTGRTWNGSVNYFINCEAAPDLTKVSSIFRSQTGITDVKYAGNDQFLAGEDSGTLHFFGVETPKGLPNAGDSCERGGQYLVDSRSTVCEHDDGITSVSVFPDKQTALTGGRDMNIIVWDMEMTMQRHLYRMAHKRIVTSVCAQMTPASNACVFASCSLDRNALLWDTRKSKPARYLIRDASCELQSVEWHRTSEHMLAVGSMNGEIYLIDDREAKLPLYVMKCYERPVFRMCFASHCPDFLAVCGNTTEVKVYDCSAEVPRVVYSDNRHRDFVRGLDWNPATHKLTSCGWDMQVLSHSVTPHLQTTSMDTK